MARERIVTGESLGPEEEVPLNLLRPQRLDEVIGQRDLVEKLSISLKAARDRGEPVEHVLMHGPPGLGKTTLAHVIGREMGAAVRLTSGPALTRPGDLVGLLTNLDEGDVLFIDEIHRLGPAVEEYIYPAMEDFRVEFTVDSGMHAKSITLPLKPFTLIGATTRAGLLSGPLRARFGIVHHLQFYKPEEIETILIRSANLLKMNADGDALNLLASRARGTPRVANRLLRRVRDFAQVKAKGKLTLDVAAEALKLEGVDEVGLDQLDREYLRVIITTYAGGPVGIEAIAATLNEDIDTLVDVVEPYLLQVGLLARTRKGRLATLAAYTHLKQTPPERPADASLFDQ
ncbi:MAG: Holliday junction branch migration DNA helicase RuvB [Phycisphaerae bacterium]|nr:Holliday junction branch migration DNA helicase RuvB [Phycisphaerae bacterium]